MNLKKDIFLIFSERLKYLRENNNLTQKALSKELRKRGFYITEDMISAFERGITEPKFNQIYAICEFFNTTSDFLFGYVQIPLTVDSNRENLDFYYILKSYLIKEKIDEDTVIELIELIKKLLKGILSINNDKDSNM